MQKRVSMSFSLFAIAAVMSLSALLSIPSKLISAFQHFNIMSFLATLGFVAATLLPFALVALLYWNAKRDVKKITYILLMVCSALYALRFVRNVTSLLFVLVNDGLPSFGSLVTMVNVCITAVALLLAAISIKKEQSNLALKILVSVAVYANLIPLVASYVAPDVIPSYSLPPLLVLIGLSMLPKTLYDNEHCVCVNKKSLTVIGVLLAAVLLVSIISDHVLSQSDNNGGSGGNSCFNCNGSGYDTANNCPCVWCGGDGQSSWNP